LLTTKLVDTYRKQGRIKVQKPFTVELLHGQLDPPLDRNQCFKDGSHVLNT